MRAKAPARPEQSKQPRSVAANLDISENFVVSDIRKNGSQIIRVSHTSYKGREYCDVRLWVMDDTNNFRPTRQGISVKPELLADLIQALMVAGRSITGSARHG